MSGSSSSEVVHSSMAEYAPLIILLPMLAMPVILFLGKVFNTNPISISYVRLSDLRLL